MNALEKYAAKKKLIEKLAKKKNYDGLKALGLTLGGGAGGARLGQMYTQGLKNELLHQQEAYNYGRTSTKATRARFGRVFSKKMGLRRMMKGGIMGATTGAAIASIFLGLKKHKATHEKPKQGGGKRT